VGDPQVEGAAQDRTLVLERFGVAEVLPQPERHLGQHDSAAPAATVGMPAITIIGSDIGHAGSLSPPAGTADAAP